MLDFFHNVPVTAEKDDSANEYLFRPLTARFSGNEDNLMFLRLGKNVFIKWT